MIYELFARAEGVSILRETHEVIPDILSAVPRTMSAHPAFMLLTISWVVYGTDFIRNCGFGFVFNAWISQAMI